MRKALADSLGLDAQAVNIKATTMEGLGCIGREEAIAAMCMVLLRPAPS
jgi:2-C-methyl-D-erythritol 2,4-cyclodiphosphate synthase